MTQDHRPRARSRVRPVRRNDQARCLNPSCGHKGAHYVPPSMGDRGFFACESFCEACRPALSQDARPGETS